MDKVWYSSRLSGAIINNEVLGEERNVATDIVSGQLDIHRLVENMQDVLTNVDPEIRERGMIFFTKVLKELPKQYLSDMQIKFISRFYVDRLKDNHRIIPAVLEGYATIVEMEEYKAEWSSEFFVELFKEVSCQSQGRHDRYNVYYIINTIMNKDMEYVKSLGPDFVYGVISAMDGERDPRNLIFLFSFLPKFIKNVPLGHLVGEMFEVIACYYPIDFNAPSSEGKAVTRDDLANALIPCLCAIPDFGEPCLTLLLEKLQADLRQAKKDSLDLLAESCKVFEPQVYFPFLKALWAEIRVSIMHKSDDALRLCAHQALAALITNLSITANKGQEFETFVKGIIIVVQRDIADATTVANFIKATAVVMTMANATKEACIIVTKIMVPSIIAYYEFKRTEKLQLASLEFLADLFQVAKKWEVVDFIGNHIMELPSLCLKAVSQQDKDYQIVGLKTLLKVKELMSPDLVLPFVEILVSFVQRSQDADVLQMSINTIHSIAVKYPEMIMDYVVKGKFDINHLAEDKPTLQKRARLLSNLASIDDFTKVIIEEMLKMIVTHDEDACQVVEALSEAVLDNCLYNEEKVVQIESDHGLIENVIAWLYQEKDLHKRDTSDGFALVKRLMGKLPPEKQKNMLDKHTQKAIDKCSEDNYYFFLLEALYGPLRQGVSIDYSENIVNLSILIALEDDQEELRNCAAGLLAQLLNKADFGKPFEVIYEILKSKLDDRTEKDTKVTESLIMLYAWLTKSLVMRGSSIYSEWFYKIINQMDDPNYSEFVAKAMKLIMSTSNHSLTKENHCRISPLYHQRVFVEFFKFTQSKEAFDLKVKEDYYLTWAYLLKETPTAVYSKDLDKVARIIIDSVIYNKKELLIIMIGMLTHLVQIQHPSVIDSLQSLLPRLTILSRYKESMDVRIASLKFLAYVADAYNAVHLIPYKQDIIIGLASALDDKKRLVRDVAVKARSRWFLVGGPGDKKD